MSEGTLYPVNGDWLGGVGFCCALQPAREAVAAQRYLARKRTSCVFLVSEVPL